MQKQYTGYPFKIWVDPESGHNPALLTMQMRKKRLLWAKANQHWTVAEWRTVLFSDEKIFRTESHKKGHHVTRTTGEKYSPYCISGRPKRSLQVHAWGLIGYNGTGHLRIIHGNLNALRYRDEVIHDLDQVGPPLVPWGTEPIFQQDKAPPHSVRVTQQFLAARNIRTLDWPGNSPDLNPIEHLWAYLTRKLAAQPFPTNHAQYWRMMHKQWNDVSSNRRECYHTRELE